MTARLRWRTVRSSSAVPATFGAHTAQNWSNVMSSMGTYELAPAAWRYLLSGGRVSAIQFATSDMVASSVTSAATTNAAQSGDPRRCPAPPRARSVRSLTLKSRLRESSTAASVAGSPARRFAASSPRPRPAAVTITVCGAGSGPDGAERGWQALPHAHEASYVSPPAAPRGMVVGSSRAQEPRHADDVSALLVALHHAAETLRVLEEEALTDSDQEGAERGRGRVAARVPRHEQRHLGPCRLRASQRRL
eukprot:6400474-Pyramimonas_sp.AAC.3